jgi:hypothetical protein
MIMSNDPAVSDPASPSYDSGAASHETRGWQRAAVRKHRNGRGRAWLAGVVMPATLLLFGRRKPASQPSQTNDAADGDYKQSGIIVRNVSAASNEDSSGKCHDG